MILVEVVLLDGCSGRLVPEEVADHASEALTMKFVDPLLKFRRHEVGSFLLLVVSIRCCLPVP